MPPSERQGDADVVVLCSWCWEDEAIGLDQWTRAPTCRQCAQLVTVRPFDA